MASPIVFYSRCKPQDVDAIEIVLAEKRIFIGHPMARAGAHLRFRRNIRKCVVDLLVGEMNGMGPDATSDKRRQFNQNRNLVRNVGIGLIALVPRLGTRRVA